jgi:Domain of unknown function (DUF6316)
VAILSVNRMDASNMKNRKHNAHRLEGRLFAEAGCLFLVLEVNTEDNVARVSCTLGGERHVLDMPLDDLFRRFNAGSNVILDNLNSAESLERISQRADGWYFSTREGVVGPYADQSKAAHQLCRYILLMQTDPPARSAAEPIVDTAPQRRMRGRRAADTHSQPAALGA